MKKKILVIFFVGIFMTLSASRITLGSNITESNQYVVLNNPPSKPIVDGPSEVDKGERFYLFVQSTDPEGDDIYYKTQFRESSKSIVVVDIFGPYPSGEIQKIGTFWFISPPPITYTGVIMIQAIDVHDARGETTTFATTAPISYNQFNMFHQFLELLKLIQNNLYTT